MQYMKYIESLLRKVKDLNSSKILPFNTLRAIEQVYITSDLLLLLLFTFSPSLPAVAPLTVFKHFNK
jgi:hypothetical protein